VWLLGGLGVELRHHGGRSREVELMGSGVKAAVVGVAGALLALVLGLVTLAGGSGSSTAAQGAVAVSVLGQLQQDECVATGPVPTLDAAQAPNAETIVAAAVALGAGEQGAQIALMVAYTESGLDNLGPESGNDGSLGLFQQRASEGWGTPAQEEDPTDATGMFIQRLLAVSDLDPQVRPRTPVRNTRQSALHLGRWWLSKTP
jgi:hypothetical protein